jgi:hypothetical protein
MQKQNQKKKQNQENKIEEGGKNKELTILNVFFTSSSSLCFFVGILLDLLL